MFSSFALLQTVEAMIRTRRAKNLQSASINVYAGLALLDSNPSLGLLQIRPATRGRHCCARQQKGSSREFHEIGFLLAFLLVLLHLPQQLHRMQQRLPFASSEYPLKPLLISIFEPDVEKQPNGRESKKGCNHCLQCPEPSIA